MVSSTEALQGTVPDPFLFSLDTSGYRCRAEIFHCWVYCVGREECVSPATADAYLNDGNERLKFICNNFS